MTSNDGPAIVAIHLPIERQTLRELSLLWLIDFPKIRRSFGLVNRSEHHPWQTLIRKQWLLTLIRHLGGGSWSETILQSQRVIIVTESLHVSKQIWFWRVLRTEERSCFLLFKTDGNLFGQEGDVKKSNWRQWEPLKERQWMSLTDWIIKKVRLPAPLCVTSHMQASTHMLFWERHSALGQRL